MRHESPTGVLAANGDSVRHRATASASSQSSSARGVLAPVTGIEWP
jgi:hypothetical protein